jgi:hypothetical protein
MSRPQPTLIATHVEGDRCIEICAADAVYAVLYQGKPIKIRTHNPAVRYQGYKYGKSMFPESGHAIRLANKLNLLHSTEDFTVAVMNSGRSVPVR